jgi:penicillin-binding protein A
VQANGPDPGDRDRESRRPSAAPASERRRRLVTRALPIALVALVAFIIGAVAGRTTTPLSAARTFAEGWAKENFRQMHDALSDDSRRQYPLKAFERAYDDADSAATISRIETGEVGSAKTPSGGEAATFDVVVHTNAFGVLRGTMVLPLAGDSIQWSPTMVFPGLRAGEHLERRTRIPTRASILAKDGAPLAEGPATARSSPDPSYSAITGTVSPPKGKEDAEQQRLGFPPGSATGTSGLELAFNTRLEGRPGGQLLAVGGSGTRVLASTTPVPGKPVHTTIDPSLQRAAVTALGSTLGGVAVLDARTGEVRGLAGIAFSGPQPPGSTFKLITSTAALDAGIVKTTDQFPVETQTNAGGRIITNANNEACGGSFVQSFANSCNTVFAPLGVKLGSDRLVGTAEKYGFNSPPSLYNDAALAAVKPAMSTIPKEISNPVDLAVSAIGQGEVLATPLEMASVSQTIANQGVSEPTAIVTDKDLLPSKKPVRVTSSATTRILRTLMLAVVHFGTGTAAQIPGIEVAGKTGTAELGPVAGSTDLTNQRKDAWFTAFAPAGDPKLAVAAMVVNANGDGGTIAAPIVRSVLESGLGGG